MQIKEKEEVQGIQVYRGEWMQLLVHDTIILIIPVDVPINMNNIKQFEKAFALTCFMREDCPMKTKNERIFYHPYEYKLFEEHLQDMAAKGWELLDIIDHNYFLTLHYASCEPHVRYYYTDFCNDFSYFIFSEASRKSMDYKEFVESYGYQFVAGKRGLMVYTSETEIQMELREENQETRKQLRKASYKSMLFPLIMLTGSLFILIISLQSIFLNFSINALSNTYTFARIAQYGAMSLLFAYMMFPILWWRFTGRMSHSFHHMRFRFYLNIFGIAMWLPATFLVSYTKIFIVAFVCFLLSLTILMIIWDYLNDKRMRRIITLLSLSGIVVLCALMLRTTTLDYTNPTLPTIATFTSEQFGLPTLDTEVYKSASHAVSSEDTTYYTKGKNNDPEEGYQPEEIIGYHIYYVKDTILQEYIVNNIPYESGKQPIKNKVKDYTIYSLKDEVLVQKGTMFIGFDRVLYERLTIEEIDELFTNAYERYAM